MCFYYERSNAVRICMYLVYWTPCWYNIHPPPKEKPDGTYLDIPRQSWTSPQLDGTYQFQYPRASPPISHLNWCSDGSTLEQLPHHGLQDLVDRTCHPVPSPCNKNQTEHVYLQINIIIYHDIIIIHDVSWCQYRYLDMHESSRRQT